jgi:two-component system, OmpR family, alkaline phosphatase synthesis response regulator PhoP
MAEDDAGVAMVVEDLLRAEGYEVVVEERGDRAVQRAMGGDWDLLLLDWMLPALTGLEVCAMVRKQGFAGAILMLTARGQVKDRVDGLETGADDYLVKPFEPTELIARVKALMRRVRKEGTVVVLGEVKLDFTNREYWRGSERLLLTTKEAELLRYLVAHQGQVLSRERILAAVWKEAPNITPRTVDTHVAWLRSKIETEPNHPRYILTLRGEGYRFEK